MDKRSELLKQLTIDRTEQPTESGMSMWQVAIVSMLCSVCTIWLFHTFFYEPTIVQAPAVVDPANEPIDSESAPVNTEITPLQSTSAVPLSKSILNASGYITARRMATVSAETMGLITTVAVEEGMQVQEGQVLATLDATLATANHQLAQAQLNVLNARLKSISANLAEAKRQHSRVVANRFSSDADITSAQTMVESLTADQETALADIQVANIEVKRQRELLNDHTITAPFSGVVTVKNAQPGEIVAPTSAGGGFTRTGICTIVDMDSLEIEVDVNEAFIGRVFTRQSVEARLDAYPEWVIPASVIAIIPTADRSRATVQVRIGIEQKDPRILPDMGVKVAFMDEGEES